MKITNKNKSFFITKKSTCEMDYAILLDKISDILHDDNSSIYLKDYLTIVSFFLKNDVVDYDSKYEIAEIARTKIKDSKLGMTKDEILAERIEYILDSYRFPKSVYYNLYRHKCLLAANYIWEKDKKLSRLSIKSFLYNFDKVKESKKSKSRHR